LLYGLIHQRYITSRPGIQQMLEKYELQHFGHCPRVNCAGSKVLPVGLSDTPGQDTVKLFCPSCLDIYTPPNSRFQTVDGAFFGTTFGCLFFMTFPELDISLQKPNVDATAAAAMSIDGTRGTSTPASAAAAASVPASPAAATKATPPQPPSINGIGTANLAPGLGIGHIYEPRIYGFRVSERAKSGPRMKWLREKPTDINETDEVRRFEADQADAGNGEEASTASKPRKGRITRNGRLRVNGATGSSRSGGSPMEVVNDGG
jgi:casein kinase II subunit beta